MYVFQKLSGDDTHPLLALGPFPVKSWLLACPGPLWGWYPQLSIIQVHSSEIFFGCVLNDILNIGHGKCEWRPWKVMEIDRYSRVRTLVKMWVGVDAYICVYVCREVRLKTFRVDVVIRTFTFKAVLLRSPSNVTPKGMCVHRHSVHHANFQTIAHWSSLPSFLETCNCDSSFQENWSRSLYCIRL